MGTELSRFDKLALPEDHEDQLQLGFHIVENAFRGRMLALEAEIRDVKQNSTKTTSNTADMESMHTMLGEALGDANKFVDQLVRENDMLHQMFQDMARHLASLENMKKSMTLMVVGDEVEGSRRMTRKNWSISKSNRVADEGGMDLSATIHPDDSSKRRPSSVGGRPQQSGRQDFTRSDRLPSPAKSQPLVPNEGQHTGRGEPSPRARRFKKRAPQA